MRPLTLTSMFWRSMAFYQSRIPSPSWKLQTWAILAPFPPQQSVATSFRFYPFNSFTWSTPSLVYPFPSFHSLPCYMPHHNYYCLLFWSYLNLCLLFTWWKLIFSKCYALFIWTVLLSKGIYFMIKNLFFNTFSYKLFSFFSLTFY